MSHHHQSLAGRLRRRLRVGVRPPIRASDRVERLSSLLCAAVVLCAVPLALTVGTVTWADGRAAAAREAADRHQVQAVLVRDVAEWTEDLPWRMSATWAGPDGRPRQGQVLLPRPAIPGDTVAIWVDDEGRRTSEPRPLVEVLSAAVAAGALTFVCGATLALLGHLLVRRVLWPYRSREWEQDWASVEPRWTDRA